MTHKIATIAKKEKGRKRSQIKLDNIPVHHTSKRK